MLLRRGCRVHYCFFNLGGAAHEIGVKQMAYHVGIVMEVHTKFVLLPLMLTDANPLNAAIYIKNSVLSLVYGEDGINQNNVNIIIFLLMLGALTSLLTVSGSNQAFCGRRKHSKNRRGAKLLATACLVFLPLLMTISIVWQWGQLRVR